MSCVRRIAMFKLSDAWWMRTVPHSSSFHFVCLWQHYDLPEEEVAAYKALLKDSKERLGLDSFVPWNQVRPCT